MSTTLLWMMMLACSGGEGADGEEEIELYINEFMPSNTQTITDETGAYPDWVELYNGGDAALSLEGFYLTDDLDSPNKAPLDGDLVIEPGGFIVFWADKDTLDGALHLPFNLRAEGEEIGLYMDGAYGYDQIDAVAFGAQAEDIAVARSPDGTGDWLTTDAATPGASNN